MNYTDKDFAKVSLNEESLDFSPFLTFCRELKKIYPQNAKNIGHLQIDDIPIPKDIKDSMLDFKKGLIHILCSTEVTFIPLFIELSLFDPEDRTGKTFYSLLFSDNKDALSSYYVQMGCNLTETHISTRPRSPIIPNRHLHEYIYYSLHIEDQGDNQNLFFNEINPDSTWMTLGHYNIDDAKSELFAETKEELSKSISGFLQDVSDDSISYLSVKNGKHRYNYAALIPLFRPAAAFKGDIERIYNGGGLFIYGHLKDEKKEDRLILEIQSNLTKSIFQTSHSQIAFDEKDRFINTLELKLIHQIKNKVSHGLVEKLESIRNNIEGDEDSLNDITDAIDFTKKLVTKLTAYLISFREFLPKPEEETEGIVCMIDAEKIIEEEAAKIDIPLHFLNNHDLGELNIKMDKSIFQVIVSEFFENANREYNKKINLSKTRELEVYFEKDNLKSILIVSVLSKNLQFLDIDNLHIFGQFPLANTTSTGLGLYFLNKILEQAGAKRFEDGRFISPKNLPQGSVIMMKLPVDIQKVN
jgi:hypothetical protein